MIKFYQKIKLKAFGKFIALLFLGLISTSTFFELSEEVVEARGKNNIELQKIIRSACEGDRYSYIYASMNRMVRSIRKKNIDWQRTIKSFVYPACFLEFPGHMLRMSFNLAYFALKKGIKDETIEKIVPLLSIRGLSSKDFNILAHSWEKLQTVGIGAGDIKNLFHEVIGNYYSAVALEGIAMIYVSLRVGGSSHDKAQLIAIKNSKKFKYSRTAKIVIKKALEVISSLSNNNISKTSVKKETTDIETKSFWEKYSNAIKFSVIKHRSIYNKKWNEKKFTSIIKKWLKTRYKYGGYSKKGIDCSGFVLKVLYNQFPNDKLPRTSAYLARRGKLVKKEDLQMGDLVFFAASSIPNKITHVGIYYKDGQFAHASTKRGVKWSKLDMKYYKKRFITARRLF